MRAVHRSLVLMLLTLITSSSAAQWKLSSMPYMIGSGPYRNQGAMAYADGVAWAGLYDVYRSTDRGNSWTKVASPWRTLSGYIIWMSFLDRNNGCVCGENGLMITHDGGATWSEAFWSKTIFCAAFLGTDKDIIVGNREDYSLEISHDGGVTWKTTRLANDGLLKDMRLFEPGHVIGFVEYAYAKGDASAVVESTDFGESWTTYAGRTDPDSHSFEVLRCDHSIVLGINEEVGNYIGQDGTGELNRSTDGGATFKTILTRKNAVIRGCVVANPGVIYVPSGPGKFLESLDEGATWTEVTGPSMPADSHGLIAIDDTTLLATDADGSILRRVDPRGSVQLSAPDPGISPMLLSYGSAFTPCSLPDTVVVSISKSCATAEVKSLTITGDATGFSASQSADSIEVIYSPGDVGVHQATLVLTLTNGHVVEIPVTATVHETVKPQFSTANVQTDTIGATVYVPFRINRTFDLRDLRFSVRFDTTDLEYVGATLDSMPQDLTERTAVGYSRISAASIGTDTANIIWLAFRYFPTQECTTIAMDSVSYTALADGVCAFDTALTATICAPPECNQQLLSHYTRYGILTPADVHFDATRHALAVKSNTSIPEATISIFNLRGDLVLQAVQRLRPEVTETIQLPNLASGTYIAQIGFVDGLQVSRFTVVY